MTHTSLDGLDKSSPAKFKNHMSEQKVYRGANTIISEIGRKKKFIDRPAVRSLQ